MDEVINIFSATDETGARGLNRLFCAASLTRIPTVPDDLSELAAIKSDLTALKQQMNTLITSMARSTAECRPHLASSRCANIVYSRHYTKRFQRYHFRKHLRNHLRPISLILSGSEVNERQHTRSQH